MRKKILKSKYLTYDDIIKSFGVKVVGEFHDGSYQGDSYYVVKDGERFGYISFAYGSCSVCDALLWCGHNLCKINKLADEIYNGIIWHDSRESLRKWAEERDWEGSCFGRWYKIKEMVLNSCVEDIF